MPNLEFGEDELVALHEALERFLEGSDDAPEATLKSARMAYDRIHRILAWGYGSSRRLGSASADDTECG